MPNDGAGFLRKTEKLLPPFQEKLVRQIPGSFSFLPGSSVLALTGGHLQEEDVK